MNCLHEKEWRFALVTNDCNVPVKVELTLRRGVNLAPRVAKEFEGAVCRLVEDMFRSDADTPPIEVEWSKECYQGRKIEVDVVVRLMTRAIADISPFAVVDFWIQMVSTWVQMVPYFAQFGLGIAVLDRSGQPYTRISRAAICGFSPRNSGWS